MARYVYEVMNREVVGVPPTTTVGETLGRILTLGISGVPVVDASGQPVGMASLRDLCQVGTMRPVSEVMTFPVMTVGERATVLEASRLLSRHRFHRMPVVNAAGRVVGILACVDLLRALVGLPPTHPDDLPHYDEITGLVWSDQLTFELASVEFAPDGAGLLALIAGPPGSPDRVEWLEAASNLRTRITDLLSTPQPFPLARIIADAPLRFRVASATDPEHRRRALDSLRSQTWSTPT